MTAAPHPMRPTYPQTLVIVIPYAVDDPLSTVPPVRDESVKSGLHEAVLDEPAAGIIEMPDTDATTRAIRQRDSILGIMFLFLVEEADCSLANIMPLPESGHN